MTPYTFPGILRVFPRRTKFTPTDENTRFGVPGMFEKADEVHISVTFTYDLPKAEFLARQWEQIAPVKIGGPATGMRGEEFTPGMYLGNGAVITSRGCNNRCWFCSVWKREGNLRELEIKDGYNVMDDNLLACSDEHIKNVFEMLARQKQRPKFTGGLEAKLLNQWHVDELFKLRPTEMYFAYDTSDDLEPLIIAGKMLRDSGFKIKHPLFCYVLIGFPKDTFENAENRMVETIKAGFMPFAMLYKNEKGQTNRTWRRFSREWNRPVIVSSKIKNLPS